MDIDQHLDETTIRQLSWKAGVTANIAVTIVRGFIEDRIQWADEVDLRFVLPTDVNCIGLTWRRLCTLGILKPMGHFRRSIKGSSRGRKVFQYRIASEPLARAFLKRNAMTPNMGLGQLEMPVDNLPQMQ